MTDYAAFDLLPEAVIVLDGDQRIVHVNARADSLLGLDSAAIGRKLGDALDLRDDSGTNCADGLASGRALADRLPERVFHATLADGSRRAVSVTGRVDPAGGLVLTFRHAGRRERVENARSDLVATVSHEIRSPLTSVKGFTRTLLAKWDRFDDDQKRHMLTTINADADRVTRLLGELLDVARIDAGRVQLHRESVDVGEVVRRVAERAQHLATERPIVVEVRAGLPRVHADVDKLQQILLNLIDNALQHAPAGPVRVTVTERATTIDVAVADEGPGVAEDQHRQIFGKFARGRGSRGPGSGLGLYITKGLVEAHGGSVYYEPGGVGATFVVSLPKRGVDLRNPGAPHTGTSGDER